MRRLGLLMAVMFVLVGQASAAVAPQDSSRWSVKKTAPQTLDDLSGSSADLRDPDAAKTDTTYDETTNTYRIGTKFGDSYLNTPIVMTPDEYREWSMQRSMQNYFRSKNAEEWAKQDEKNKFDFTDMEFDLGPAEKIFGPGGVKIKTQGSAELQIGATYKTVDNPSLPINRRKTLGLDFDEKIDLSLQGSVGDKMSMNLNYNSESTFDFDSEMLKLQYEGKEDEIVKLIEAGNISFPSNNSLVTGASSLFGIRTDLQFGKLKLQTAISQKRSTTKTVTADGGTQTTEFEIEVTAYDANRHFWLGHFFRDHYDSWMSNLPSVLSGITIGRIEVWVTNTSGTTTNTRNIIGFTDLGEQSAISNDTWSGTGTSWPQNSSNDLYSTIVSQYGEARDISQVYTSLSSNANLTGGRDYEKLESARKLSSSEYDVNTSLGYISLSSSLQTDQVLAVAFEYTYLGVTYQVGEFSTDITDNSNCLFVKTLKNTSCTPQMGNWDLMMRNVYSLSASNVESSNFRLDIKYLNDTSGVYISYLPETTLKDTPLIRLLGADRLDNKNNSNPNGYFDFIDGYTVDASSGRVFLPLTEPFGSGMASAIGDATISDKYVFQELYDSTLTKAKQLTDKNKFILTGKYKGSQAGVISLGAVNVPRGSVVVTAGGTTLVENSDYTVNYATGEVTIINQSILDAGTSISVSLESTGESLIRKTFLGLNWEYDFSDDFLIGGTLLHLSEQALTSKISMGSEPLNNTMLGFHINWTHKSQWLTDMLDRLPLLHCTTPSQISFQAEYAQLFTGANNQSQGDASYVDDFENTKVEFDISTPSAWMMSSTPAKFTEYSLTDDIEYGYHRALLAWYTIDPLFTRRSSSLTPSHIKSDLEQLSNHYVREVYQSELFPNKELVVGESSTLDILNLAYYPNERGAYNLNPSLTTEGRLQDPEQMWGGMARSLETTDFETANIEYIEFWLLDPFIYMREQSGDWGGELYFDLGDISEDILRDGHKYYESGMPTDGSSDVYEENNWGRYPTSSTVTYAFNNSSGARSKQDIGLNGLSSEDEATYSTYLNYLTQVSQRVSQEVYDSIAADPAGDDYHYFRGSDFDAAETSILERYKRINMPEGNSPASDDSDESYSTAYKTTPDIEDLNQDYTLNEYNNYYEYKVTLHPDSMQVGKGYIVDNREATVSLRDGTRETVNWYQYRIPLDDYYEKVGDISDFSSIRFCRMFLTDWAEPVVLRFGTLQLVSGEWRVYDYSLTQTTGNVEASGTLDMAAVSLEENNEKTPVNYVTPPGITRDVNRQQSQLIEDNEQALSLTVTDLPTGEARAVYKTYSLDLRAYRHIQMFCHANALEGDETLQDGETSVFIRFGSDYKNNYYEYEIPLTLTPAGYYDTYSSTDCEKVWPEENMLDIDFSLLTDVKSERNRLKALGEASYTEAYSEYDPDHPNNKVTVMGKPSIGEIHTIMIGVRNNSRSVRDVEVWVNELRLQDYTEDGGWAARAKLDLKLSDIATLSMQGHIETSGFGGLEESISSRRTSDLYDFSLTTNIQLGRFFPESAKVNAPLYYSYSKQKEIPKYNPLDSDITLEEALDALATKQERDSLKNLVTATTIDRNFSLTGVRVGIQSKRHPMPYDPANFTFGYSHSHKYSADETTIWETDDTWKFTANYSWSPDFKPWQPFSKIKSKSEWWKILTNEKIYFLPQNITANSEITRTYYELQERDIDDLDNSLPLTWSQDFLWNRSLSLNWDLTQNLHFSFSSATNAEIVEPYNPVNKDLYPDEYQAWKDSVWYSIRHFGTPLSFDQTFSATYKLPLSALPIFKWLTGDASYSSAYSWERGSTLSSGLDLGNTIAMQRNVKLTSKLALEDLYNLVPFLKTTNQYFSKKTSSKTTSKTKNSRKPGDKTDETDEDSKNLFEQELQLLPDTILELKHNLKTRKLRVSAIDQEGNRYRLRYKVKNNNTIRIESHDSLKIKVSVRPQKPREEQTWYKIARYAARTAMMVRSVNITYNSTYALSLPGFMTDIGDFFGQKSLASGLSPGLDFAFGFVGDDYIQKAWDRGWLCTSDSVSSPATTSLSENLSITATLEPIQDLKIDLTASRQTTKSKSIQYMYTDMPTTASGTLSMTVQSLSSAFSGLGNADNGYESKTFNKFISYLPTFRDRVEARYEGAIYPEGSTLAGQTFDADNGTVDEYSADVMIPAFLAAYCGGGTSSSLDILPSIKRMFPNWKITYSGLTRIPWVRNHFKTVTLEHSYKSIFSVGSYSSYSSYCEYMGLGYVTSATTGNPTPSSMYDISTVSINEAFSPFLGLSVTLRNSLSLSLKYNKTRVITLSMTSQQITESVSNDWVIGASYKIDDLKLFKTTKKRKITNRRSNNDDDDESSSKSKTAASSGMSNPLNLRLDISFRNQTALNRNILTGLSEATSGNEAIKFSFSADYTLSRLLTLTGYYDQQTNKPLLSSSSYPTTTRDFGISIKFSLSR